MRAFLFSLLTILTFSACFDKTEDEFNDVFIRLENLTGEDLTGVTIGKRIYKSVDSYRHVDYVTRFDNLDNNKKTDFFNTKGQFLGYSNLRAHIDGDPILWSSEQKEEELMASGAFEDEWDNPFSDNGRDGLSLPEGDYNFKISLNDDGNLFIIDIVEE